MAGGGTAYSDATSNGEYVPMCGSAGEEDVEKANHEQLARWYRFLPSGDTKEQQKIQERISERFKALGGMTQAISKKIGF